MPSIQEKGLWAAQLRAVRNLEVSLYDDRPRALIQMATGSGKTVTAVTSIYRLIKFGGARRVLFLVDRANLGRQAFKEFQQYEPPDDNKKFTQLYNVQHLNSNKLDPVARVCITTIQRLYSMLSGEELDPEVEELSAFDSLASLARQPVPVAYNNNIPVEFFDFIWTDECHRSIYNLWRQVLEYFDAYLVGLTATPSKQTFGFFRQNLVMEYGHEEAVADGVNVDFNVYRIRTEITERGSKVEAGLFVDKRDRETRSVRWERLDDDLTYDAGALDRSVVAEDQIRTVIRTFKDRLFSDIFPGRKEVPKTLIYAKDDSHADDIVRIVREVFGKGNDFSEKITYRTGTALTNPPFGKKSSVTVVNEEGEQEKETLTVVRDDFWASTSNKQLNFVQHVKTLLEINGRAAVVVPDNVLFEGGVGEVVRRKLLHGCDVHALLRLPTGIFYKPGVKANVLFFDKKPGREKPWTDKLWIYDLRTNQHFTLKTNPLKREDLDDFVTCFKPENRHERRGSWSEKKPEGRWRAFTYQDLLQRDKVSLDIFWLKDESLEDSANLPAPDVIAAEIADDLRMALEQFEAIQNDLTVQQ